MKFVFRSVTANLAGTAKTRADEKETKLDAASPLLAKGFGVHATLK